MTFKDELEVHIKARYPVIWLTSYEEMRVQRMIKDIAQEQKKRFVIWTSTKGFVDAEGKVVQQGAADLVEALNQVIEDARSKATIYLFLDLHKWLDQADKTCYRILRDAVEVVKSSPSTIIVLSPVLAYPKEIEKAITVLDVPYPDRAELQAVLKNFTTATKIAKEGIQLPTPEEEDAILRSGAGLTEDEMENIIAKSLVTYKRVDPAMVVAEKEQTIRKSGVIEFYQSLEGLDNVGGLDNLKAWITRRGLTFSQKAREFGLRPPRGIFLAGVTGCGKSLSVKAMASYLKLPLLMVDASRVLGSYVGQSEANLKAILKTAEAVSPAILFIDECEKLLPPNTGGDSGVGTRLMGGLLTWMQENKKPVIVAATANDPLKLPVELMNRFDVCFFVDLPTKAEREEVWSVLVRKVGRDPKAFSLTRLAEESEGWSGREIEAVISEAMIRAFEAGKDIDTVSIIEVLKGRIPLSVQRREDIEKMRRWGRDFAVSASSRPIAEELGTRAVELE
jgi:SpoVK/Ycf46/Vps4 family AAA+-type ATPase